MDKSLWILKLNTLLLIVLFSSCELSSSQFYYDKANKLESAGKYEKAIPFLDISIKKNPEFLGAYINRGADKAILGRFNDAIKDYEEVIKRDSTNILALFNKANNLKRINEMHAAITIYNHIMNLKGGERLQYDNVKNPYVYNEAADFDVPSIEIQYERALAYLAVDSLKKAFYGFQQCQKGNYMKRESLNIIGTLYSRNYQDSIACEYFTRAANLGDTNAIYNVKKFCGSKDTIR